MPAHVVLVAGVLLKLKVLVRLGFFWFAYIVYVVSANHMTLMCVMDESKAIFTRLLAHRPLAQVRWRKLVGQHRPRLAGPRQPSLRAVPQIVFGGGLDARFRRD